MRVTLLMLLGCVAVAGCAGHPGTPSARTAGSPAASTAAASVLAGTPPDIALPAGPLRDLVPRAGDLPAGLVPILAGSGPRDEKAVASYSADPTKAATVLTQHGFRTAYVAQYADPTTGRVLSVVVARFATAAGAAADLRGDLAASSGELLPAATVGQTSQVRRQPLPGGAAGQLVTVRFRKAATTWLVAYGARPTADPQVALGIARILAGRP